MLIGALISCAGAITAFQLVLKARSFTLIYAQHAKAKPVIARVASDCVIDVAFVVKKSVAILCTFAPGREVGTGWL